MRPLALLFTLLMITGTALAQPRIDSVTPSVVATAGHTLVTFHGANLIGCFGACDFDERPQIMVDGTPGPIDGSSYSESAISFRTPAHGPGAADVTVIRRDGQTTTAVDVLTYVFEMEDYEAVLVPFQHQTTPTPGAFGSMWISETYARNENDEAVFIQIDEPCAILCPPIPSLEPRTTEPIALTDSGGPIVLFVERSGIANVHFGILVRDLSRQAEALGVEIPVVREDEFLSASSQILNVPTDPRFRLNLRIYEPIPSGSAAIRMTVLPHMGDEEIILAQETFAMAGDPFLNTVPFHVTVGDLVARYPGIAARESVRIVLEPLGEIRYWALLTVTNNQAQHVTTMTPQ